MCREEPRLREEAARAGHDHEQISKNVWCCNIRCWKSFLRAEQVNLHREISSWCILLTFFSVPPGLNYENLKEEEILSVSRTHNYKNPSRVSALNFSYCILLISFCLSHLSLLQISHLRPVGASCSKKVFFLCGPFLPSLSLPPNRLAPIRPGHFNHPSWEGGEKECAKNKKRDLNYDERSEVQTAYIAEIERQRRALEVYFNLLAGVLSQLGSNWSATKKKKKWAKT